MCAIGCLMVDSSESLDFRFDTLGIPFTLVFDLIEGISVENDLTIGLTLDFSFHDSLQLSISIRICVNFTLSQCL